MKNDRVMADGAWLMAKGTDGGDHRPDAISDQLSGMTGVRELMWRHAGLFRSREGLMAAVDTLERASVPTSPTTAEEWRQSNLVTVARLIARAALRREESRGGHFRADFPERDDRRWKIHVVDVRGVA
jgi:aspartate oxidase